VNRSCGSRSHARAEVVAGLREPKPWEPKPRKSRSRGSSS